MLLSAAVDLWLVYKAGENVSGFTLRFYRGLLDQFLRYVGDRGQIGSIQSADIAGWLAAEASDQRKPRLAASSVEARYRALSAFFTWAEDCIELGNPVSPMGWISARKRKVKRPKKGMPALRYAAFEDYCALVGSIDLATVLDYRDFVAVGLMYWAGVRVGELCELAVGDLDIRARLITVRAGKGDKSRVIPMDEDLASALVAWLERRPGSLRSLIGIGADGVRSMLRRRCKAMGQAVIYPHRFRHGFAMWSLNNGADISAVAAMMGHASVALTERVYARWRVDGLQRQFMAAAERVKGGK